MQAEEIARVYQEQAPIMLGWLYRVGTPEPAEDVLATAWCNALGHACECQNLSAYVWQCLHNARVTAFRQRRTHVDLDNLQAPGPSWLAAAEARVVLAELGLSRAERTLLTALLQHEWAGGRLDKGTWSAVGPQLGITANAAKARWARLQRRLQAEQRGWEDGTATRLSDTAVCA